MIYHNDNGEIGGPNQNLIRAFRLKKLAIRIFAKLQCIKSFKPAFKNLNLLTFPFLLEAATYCMFKIIRNESLEKRMTGKF